MATPLSEAHCQVNTVSVHIVHRSGKVVGEAVVEVRPGAQCRLVLGLRARRTDLSAAIQRETSIGSQLPAKRSRQCRRLVKALVTVRRARTRVRAEKGRQCQVNTVPVQATAQDLLANIAPLEPLLRAAAAE